MRALFDVSMQAEIVNLLDKQQKTQADIVIGYYLSRKVSKATIITSKIWELIVFIIFGLRVTDIDCGFKLINKKVIDNMIIKLPPKNNFRVFTHISIAKHFKIGIPVSKLSHIRIILI